MILPVLWGAVAALALLWPSHAIGWLDGVPLDSRVEAILIGLLVPALCWLHPQFLRSRSAQSIAAALVIVKACSALFLAQEGWCVRFVTPAPLNGGGRFTQLSWDARADWRHDVPRCSAVAARPYNDFSSFPIWFLNLAGPPDRPPRTVLGMAVDGYLSVPSAGTLDLGFARSQHVSASIDDRPVADTTSAVAVDGGTHHVHASTVIAADGWRFAPLWNGRGLFATTLTTTLVPPRAVDRWLSRPAALVTAWLTLALLAWWIVSAARALTPPPLAVGWIVATSVVAAVGGAANLYRAGRLAVVPLAAAAVVPLPPRLRNARGAFLLIGVPWLTLIAVSSLPGVGTITLFSPGDDFSLFQRFTYRIYMQGYWLEGGQWAFWNQPLYRWIIGLLHIVFGDSSVGDWYLDAACLLVGALFAFVVCTRAASFRWGLTACALTLMTVAIGPSWWVVGRDLSEITAAGFAYAAALIIITSERGATASAERVTPTLAAGVFAVLCFYTRLNHLVWVAAAVVLLPPLQVPADDIWRPRRWFSTTLLLHGAVLLAVIGAGVLLFAWRTWYYTGVFSVLFGTQRDLVATVQPTDSFTQAIVHMIQSVLVQVTVQDPPRFEPRSVLVMTGVLVSALAVLRVPWCRDVPAGPALFCLAGLVGALVAHGTAYTGRFSIHLMPVTVAVAVCFAARVLRQGAPAPAVSRT